MTPRSRVLRQKIARAARRMAELGLVRGSSGNISLRRGNLVLIIPSSIPYDWLRPKQVIAIELPSGRKLSGCGEPSSEWRMHLSIYRAREDVKAIVHTHSPYATAASFRKYLPLVHDEGKLLFGEEVPVSEHAPPGTWALAEAVAKALGRGKAALIARHGAVAVGRTLTEALLLAEKLEEAAQLALILDPEPKRGRNHEEETI